MAAQLKNPITSVAGLAFAAGLCVVAATPAKADFDWSISLNLGWCAPDPYCAPVYSGWSCDPCPPRWGWRSCYTPYYYRPYYYNPYAWGTWYYPSYAFSQPLYLPSGTTFVYSSYSPWGSGFTYTSTTYYSPYIDYYRPAYSSGWGLSFTYSNYDNDCGYDGWRRRGYDCDRDDRRDRVEQFPTVTAPQALTTGQANPFKPNGPMSNPFPSSGGTPQVTHAEAPGVAGPPAEMPLGQKGPRRIDPVAVKPVESKPLGAKPVQFPSQAQSKPTNPRLPSTGVENIPTVKPTSPNVKPTQVASKPSLPSSAGKPIATTKPQPQASVKPVKAPEFAEKAPGRAQPAPESKPFAQAAKPSIPFASPDVKPSAPITEKPSAVPSSATRSNYNRSPSVKPASLERSTAPKMPDLPAAMPSAKPSPSRGYSPTVSSPQRSSAPSGAPRVSAPAPRASAPSQSPRISAPSAPRPSSSAPMPSGKPGMSGGDGKRR